MKRQYRVGVLGLKMGQLWAEAVAQHPDAELLAVYDKQVKLTTTLAGRLGSHAALSEDDFFRQDLDVVVVATPDHLHVPQSVRALAQGCHVICEKPMAPTVRDCRTMLAAVKRAKRMFMVGQVCRYTPAFKLAKTLLARGEIGDLVFIESEYYHNYLHAPGVANWRKDPKIRREGFIGGGCHAMDLIRWLAGCDPVETFCYMNHKLLPDWPTCDTGVAVFKFRGDVIGKVFVSIGVKAGYSMRTVLHGTGGSIICDNTSPHLQLYAERDAVVAKAAGKYAQLPVEVNSHNVADELRDFIACLKAGRHPPTDGWQGMQTVAFGEACLKSARTGRPVKLSK